MDASGARPSGDINLLVVIGSLDVGGSEKQVTELLTRLPRTRFSPRVLTFDGGGSGASTRHRERIAAAGIPIATISSASAPVAVRRALLVARTLRALDRLRPDLVYAWLDEASALLAPLAKLRGVPCLVARRNVIGSSAERGNAALARVINAAERQALMVTANSTSVAADCIRRGHAASRVRLVRNGHASLEPLPVAPAPPVVFGYVAQFRPEKGHHRLVDTLARLAPGHWRVDLAGDGPLLEQVRQRVSRERLSDRVRFVGRVSDIRAFWRERHAALLLSDSEGFPNALLESAFAGRPCVATRTGGTPEVVGPGGLLAPLDDPVATAHAIEGLSLDANRRGALGEAAWRHVSSRYTIDGMLADHLGALEETYALRRVKRIGSA